MHESFYFEHIIILVSLYIFQLSFDKSFICLSGHIFLSSKLVEIMTLLIAKLSENII